MDVTDRGGAAPQGWWGRRGTEGRGGGWGMLGCGGSWWGVGVVGRGGVRGGAWWGVVGQGAAWWGVVGWRGMWRGRTGFLLEETFHSHCAAPGLHDKPPPSLFHFHQERFTPVLASSRRHPAANVCRLHG